MSVATIETPKTEARTMIRSRILDAARHAAHASHEAKLIKSVTADAIEDGKHAVKRAMKSIRRRVERGEDLRDDAAHWIRRQPLKAVSLGAGAGLLVGLAIGVAGARCGARKSE